MKKFIFPLLLIALLLTLSGCTGVLFPENEITELGDSSSNQATITSFTSIQSGRIQDMSDDGSLIVSIGDGGDSDPRSALDLYNTETKSLVNLVSSDKMLGKAMLTTKGIYYSKLTVQNDNFSYQILWYAFDMTEEVTITPTNQSATGVFYAWGENQIAYIGSGNSLILTSPEENEQKSYSFDASLEAIKMIYSPSENCLFLLASDENGSSNLYRMNLDGDRLKKNKIASNVLDFDFSESAMKLAYVKQNDTKKTLYLCEISDTTGHPEDLVEGEMSTVNFSQDGSTLYYTKSISQTNEAMKSIFETSTQEDNSLQISAPMQISTEIFANSQSPVYFSCLDNPLNQDSTGVNNECLYELSYSEQ